MKYIKLFIITTLFNFNLFAGSMPYVQIYGKLKNNVELEYINSTQNNINICSYSKYEKIVIFPCFGDGIPVKEHRLKNTTIFLRKKNSNLKIIEFDTLANIDSLVLPIENVQFKFIGNYISINFSPIESSNININDSLIQLPKCGKEFILSSGFQKYPHTFIRKYYYSLAKGG